MSERFYLDYSGEYGTIIRDSLNNDEDVYEYGIDKSEDMCNLLNDISNENKKAAVDIPTVIENIRKVFKDYLKSCTNFTEECIVHAMYTTIINNIVETQQKSTGNKQLKQQLEDCEFANRTERACHRVTEEKLKKENEELKDIIESLKEEDKNAFKTPYDDFDFSYTIDKETLDQSGDAIHLKDTHTNLDFHNGILTMIVDPPECDDEIKIKLRAARLDFDYTVKR